MTPVSKVVTKEKRSDSALLHQAVSSLQGGDSDDKVTVAATMVILATLIGPSFFV